MDKKKGLINVSVSIAFKIVILIAGILVRRFLIRQLGNEANGLNSLYISILDFLSVAELGIGTAITFCMYKPIVDADDVKVAALFGLFNKLYWIIGAIIAVGGLLVMPALPYLAKDYNFDVNLYFTFGLMLLSVVLTYVFGAKTSLINAYKNNYITTTISSCVMLLQYILQIVLIIVTKSFAWYLGCRVIASVLQWGATELFVRKKYSKILSEKQKIDPETKKEVTKNIKAMFMHKIGSAVVSASDNIIISAFIGVVVLGRYANYTSIVIAMVSVISLCFSPLTSVLGQMCVLENDSEVRRHFNIFHTFNFVLGLVFFLGYYAVIDNLITLLFADGLVMNTFVPMIITINYFIVFMEQSVRLFKDATGTFYYDRWKCLFEAALNAGLSILFVLVFPDQYKVVGVIVATIITNLCICHTVEPYVLYKHTLHRSVKEYYLRNYLYIAVFVGVLFGLRYSMISSNSQWVELFANGAISIAFSLVVAVAVTLLNKDFRDFVKRIFGKFARLFTRAKSKSPQTCVQSGSVVSTDVINPADENMLADESIFADGDVGQSDMGQSQRRKDMDDQLQDYLDKIHGILLDMMIDLDKFLRDNDLKYSIMYGTMLGAVRHKGFIPWDDDLDIVMERRDYERFIELYRASGGLDGYTLYATDDKESWLVHTKLYKNNTAMLSTVDELYAPETKENKHKEVFIDIFPLDKVPKNKQKRKKYMFKAKMRLVYTRDHPYQATNNKLLWLASKLLLSIPKSCKRKIKVNTDKYVLKYNDMTENFDFISTSDPFAIREFIPAVLDATVDAEFEGYKFMMYAEYDKLLRVSYGDYMALPPEDERKPKHDRKVIITDVAKYMEEYPTVEKHE